MAMLRAALPWGQFLRCEMADYVARETIYLGELCGGSKICLAWRDLCFRAALLMSPRGFE